jgi:hypothetical protein
MHCVGKMQGVLMLRWMVSVITIVLYRGNRTVLGLAFMKHPVTVCCLSTHYKTTLEKRQPIQQISHPVQRSHYPA